MAVDVIAVKKEKIYSHLFSICCIITKWDEYDLMRHSFVTKGFAQQTEYLVADNTEGNEFDAYTAINIFLAEAKGQYIIIVHQDVRCIDTADALLSSLNHLQSIDDTWAVCGNAGAYGYKNSFYHLTNNGRVRKTENLPAKVSSLDENLLIIKSSSNVCVSADIKDFHFYGTDICIIADFLGYTCYVIPFMVEHLSLGNLEKMMQQQHYFIQQYGRKSKARFIQTSCTKFYLGNSVAENNFYNQPFIFFWVKAFNRLKNAVKKPS